MSNFTKGIILPTTAIVAGLLSFYTAWNVWLSKAYIDISNQQAAIGVKIDVLLQRSGVDPLIFK